jgi:hypothetical protein
MTRVRRVLLGSLIYSFGVYLLVGLCFMWRWYFSAGQSELKMAWLFSGIYGTWRGAQMLLQEDP